MRMTTEATIAVLALALTPPALGQAQAMFPYRLPAQLVQSLLQASPELRLLATSRQRLGVTGEIAWRVPSLPAPDPAYCPPANISSRAALAIRARTTM